MAKETKKIKLIKFLAVKGRAGATGKELIKNVGADYGTYINGLRKAGITVQTLILITPGVSRQARYILHPPQAKAA